MVYRRLIYFVPVIAAALIGAAARAQTPPQPPIAPADERLGSIVAQQALVNVRLGVQIDTLNAQLQKLSAELAAEKKRGDAAEEKLKAKAE